MTWTYLESLFRFFLAGNSQILACWMSPCLFAYFEILFEPSRNISRSWICLGIILITWWYLKFLFWSLWWWDRKWLDIWSICCIIWTYLEIIYLFGRLCVRSIWWFIWWRWYLKCWCFLTVSVFVFFVLLLIYFLRSCFKFY